MIGLMTVVDCSARGCKGMVDDMISRNIPSAVIGCRL